jgi:hypothetical protein
MGLMKCKSLKEIKCAIRIILHHTIINHMAIAPISPPRERASPIVCMRTQVSSRPIFTPCPVSTSGR